MRYTLGTGDACHMLDEITGTEGFLEEFQEADL